MNNSTKMNSPINMPMERVNQGSSLIALLVTLVIIGILVGIVTSAKQNNQKHGTMMKEAGIDTSNYKTMIDSARKITTDASKPRQ